MGIIEVTVAEPLQGGGEAGTVETEQRQVVVTEIGVQQQFLAVRHAGAGKAGP